ncbi:hypothetical protein TBLA_0B05100 [Henningerozyma blattae CBS 6284]|uniref:MINDY deubiquitinase domain-containing protein n=1 Tax=Henningerozyma blattae (strain ATCC 34711 / CBS 6284 / DSM 70876 / NBRC 10599 / NRRL Y-10934 / UCD 77-7) TaxID=1071380 RepID=I2GYZ1_HENB6|nr:hypothetical protein TBLA_0B05100 [Tetrapisispora blattae CBS 6284]CCH59343.1 hypothetical protein TBLA_0B05100 [Tetrapisispora blattae CBS 6284]
MNFQTKNIQINGVPHKIILQNENGPCALIALVNVLLLSPAHRPAAQLLVTLVNQSNTISLDSLVQTLSELGLYAHGSSTDDISSLLQLLPKLHKGLVIDPAFNGSFTDTKEMALFRLFGVGMVHGWVIDPQLDPLAYDIVSKYSYDSTQQLLAQAYDIQQRGLQTPQATQILDTATYVKAFLARSATQLTEYGLTYLKEVLLEKSFAVLFRNDHFLTLYKNNNELYTLVTDLGYKSRTDIVWESLKSVNGSQDIFYTGDFIQSAFAKREKKTTTQTSSGAGNERANSNNTDPFDEELADSVGELPGAIINNSDNQQIRDDEALARALQEEENNARRERAQRNRSLNVSRTRSSNNNYPYGSGNNSNDGSRGLSRSNSSGQNDYRPNTSLHSRYANQKKNKMSKLKNDCIIM